MPELRKSLHVQILVLVSFNLYNHYGWFASRTILTRPAPTLAKLYQSKIDISLRSPGLVLD
jgi:hypothetical protein